MTATDLEPPRERPVRMKLQPQYRDAILRELRRKFPRASTDERQLAELNELLESMGEPPQRRDQLTGQS